MPLNPFLHWTTAGDGSWTNIQTPTRSAAATTVNGIPLDLIGDDNASEHEYTSRVMAFTGNGDKIISFLIKRGGAYDVHEVDLLDATAVVKRVSVLIDFTATTPAVSVLSGAGTVVSVTAEDTGWRIVLKAVGVVAANTNEFFVMPASGAADAADIASIYIGDIYAWNADALDDGTNPADMLRRGPFKRSEPIQLPKFGTLNDSGTAAGVTETEKRPVLRESFVAGGAVSVEAIGIDVDGTLLLYMCKYDAATDAEVVLSDALGVGGMTTKEVSFFAMRSDLTDAQRTLHTGDTVYAKVVCNSAAIDTQPTNLAVTFDIFRRN